MTRLAFGSSVLSVVPGRLACLFVIAGLLGLGAAAPTRAASPVFTLLHSFSAYSAQPPYGNSDGVYPSSPPVEGRDGNFYGTTYEGGTNGTGVIYKITPAGVFTSLYNFSPVVFNGTSDENSDGASPAAALVLGNDGNLYGTTTRGGALGNGTIFKITPMGTFTTLYSLGTLPSTNSSNHTLVQGSDGSFYGTTDDDGALGNGTIFKITPTGTFTTLHTFSALSAQGMNSDGAFPEAALVQASDGNFYGMAESGGAAAKGTVFKITPTGTFTTVYSFGTTDSDGMYPLAALVQGADGNFYGTTYGGGPSATGTVFKITPSGTLTTLYDFGTTSTAGQSPRSALVQGIDGNFYGTTTQGGLYYAGTVFMMTPTGTLTTVYNFTALDITSAPDTNADGSNPVGLVLGNDGNLYGAAEIGGASGRGTVFKITPGGVPQPSVRTMAGAATANSAAISAVATSGDGTPLTYTWSVTPAANATFTGAATGTVASGATFSTAVQVNKVGSYTFMVMATDAYGQVAVLVPPYPVETVAPVPTSISISPASASLPTGGMQTLIATVLDQFSAAINYASEPPVSWSVISGGGTFDHPASYNPTYTASSVPGPVAIQVASGSISSTAHLTVYTPITITGFTPASGPVGTTVMITGTGLTGTTVVGFTGQHAKTFTINGAGTQITTTVPMGAQTGPIALLTSDGNILRSATSFTVTGVVPKPTITSFTPVSGPVGTTVTITGTNLTGTTIVGFQGKHAVSFTVNAAGTQIITTVPMGAGTGAIAVLTNGVEAKSSTSFTVTP